MMWIVDIRLWVSCSILRLLSARLQHMQTQKLQCWYFGLLYSEHDAFDAIIDSSHPTADEVLPRERYGLLASRSLVI